MSAFPVRPDGRRSIRYRVVSGLVRLVLRLVLGRRLDVSELIAVGQAGPLIVALNHLSNIDPLVIGGFYPQTLFAMAKVELFRYRVIGWFLRGCNVFPVDRARADRAAIKTALQVLSDGQRLMIFVEGTRVAKPGMKRAEPGVGFFVRKSGATVLPIAIWGSEDVLRKGSRLPHRAATHLRVGKILSAEEVLGATDQDTADSVAKAIAELLPAQYQGAYAEAG